MSVVVQEDDGIFCYTKGADTTVMEVVRDDHDQHEINFAQRALDKFAEDGLRHGILFYFKGVV